MRKRDMHAVIERLKTENARLREERDGILAQIHGKADSHIAGLAGVRDDLKVARKEIAKLGTVAEQARAKASEAHAALQEVRVAGERVAVKVSGHDAMLAALAESGRRPSTVMSTPLKPADDAQPEGAVPITKGTRRARDTA